MQDDFDYMDKTNLPYFFDKLIEQITKLKDDDLICNMWVNREYIYPEFENIPSRQIYKITIAALVK